MKARQRLRRWHIWLGWIVGLPFLVWTVSGLVMVARPIETVRGEDLIAEVPALPAGLAPVPPAIGPRPPSTRRRASAQGVTRSGAGARAASHARAATAGCTRCRPSPISLPIGIGRLPARASE